MTTKSNVSVNLNEKLHGIELIFAAKPEQEVIDKLKEYKFRWHNTKKLWYATQSPERLEFANSLVEKEKEELLVDESQIETEDISNEHITDEEIDIILCCGSGFAQGKMRIYEQYQRNLSNSENAEFLKKEYGIGGRSPYSSSGPSEQHDAKGIYLYKGGALKPTSEVLISWPKVAQRINELITQDSYLTDKEKEDYPKYLADNELKAQRNKVSVEFKNIVVEFNEYMRETGNHASCLNQYVLSDCCSQFTLGNKLTYTLTGNDYIIPIMREAMNTIIHADTHLTDRCKSMLETLKGDLAKDLEPPVNYENDLWGQYRAIKELHPNHIVIYQVGDFYEVMGNEAIKLAEDLNYTIADRNVGEGEKVSFFGVPSYNLEKLEERLVEKGYKVFVSHTEGNEYITTLNEEKDESAGKIQNLKEIKSCKEKNIFANSYDSIGNDVILNDSNIKIFDITSKGCYFSDLNVYFKRYSGHQHIEILNLENAGKKGRECTKWSVYSDTLAGTFSDNGIDTVKDLYNSLISDRKFEDIRISQSSLKGIDVFSPFIEVKPLNSIPDKWTKSTFIHALQSGQIYAGEIKCRLSDDFAYDAGLGFSEGIRIDMSSAAKSEMEDWSSLTNIWSGTMSPDGILPLSLTCCNLSKTYFFDLSCDIAEGKRRGNEVTAGIERYNQMMEASCKAISVDDIDLQGIYAVRTLKMNNNTGIYVTANEILQGETIADRMNEDTFLALSVQDFPITDNKFYSVTNFRHRANTYIEEDPRLIPLGNWENIISGKSLKEMTKEGIYLPLISNGPFEGDFMQIRSDLTEKAESSSNFFVNKINFATTIQRLETEYKRSEQGSTSELSALIKNAESKQKENNLLFFNDSVKREYRKDGELQK